MTPRQSRLAAAGLALLSTTPTLTTAAATTHPSPGLPLAINTWGGPFTAATDAAYLALVRGTNSSSSSSSGSSVLDAAQLGCATCQAARCDGSVGYGGSPDEACETTLDALLVDGASLNAGAVAGLRRVRDAVGVARAVLDHSVHSLLAGDLATQFALQNGFVEEDLATEESRALCDEWRAARCQPNYRVDVVPDAGQSCGPYEPLSTSANHTRSQPQASHDTISMVTLDAHGAMAAGTSTNGASHKIPGRVGDGAILGSGAYADSAAGPGAGCGATGDGDVMMRFLPCYQAVESVRRGVPPGDAAEDAVRRMLRRYPAVQAGLVVVDGEGRHGGAASGWTFTYAFRGGDMAGTEVVTVEPVGGAAEEL